MQWFKMLWLTGLGVLWLAILLLLGRLPHAQSFAQASLDSTQLAFVALFSAFWAVAGSLGLARLKKARTS